MTRRSSRSALQRLLLGAPRALYVAAVVGAIVVALVPLLDRQIARQQARHAVRAAAGHGPAAADERPRAAQRNDCDGGTLLRLPREPALSSWDYVGGCGAGAGAASSTAGGAKWIGRGVRGGLLDIQCLGSQSFAADGAAFLSINTRFATTYFEKWAFGASVPIVHKRDTLDDVPEQIALTGFGDVSFELTRKLGITNATALTLLVSVPSGAHEAVRQGLVLPQHLQLGSGVPGISMQIEHTADFDGGLLVLGGSFTNTGGENSLKDFRAPSLAAWVYAGYMFGPFVPSLGLALSAKLGQDREGDRDEPDLALRRSELLDEVPIGTVAPAAAVEWSVDWLAVLLSASTPFSSRRLEGVTISLGVSSSLF